jgi:hypothetical protein
MGVLFIVSLVLAAAFAVYCVVDVFNQTKDL